MKRNEAYIYSFLFFLICIRWNYYWLVGLYGFIGEKNGFCLRGRGETVMVMMMMGGFERQRLVVCGVRDEEEEEEGGGGGGEKGILYIRVFWVSSHGGICKRREHKL